MGRLMALAPQLLLLGLQVIGSAAAQQTYPTRTVRFILPYGAASASDTTARLFADALVHQVGQAGGGGKSAGRRRHCLAAGVCGRQRRPYAVVRAGRRLHGPSLSARHAADRSVSRPQSDRQRFRSSCWLSRCLHRCTSTRSLSSWRWRGRSPESSTPRRPAAFRISCCSVFSRNQGLEVAQVPYRDIMQAPSDLAEGRIQVLSSSLAVPQPLAHAGRLKILVVTSKQRAPGEPGHSDRRRSRLSGVDI